jgi:proline dehydrogenase
MLDAISKAFFHALAGSRTIERMASRYGMSKPTSFGRRFIAGESVGEALDAARALKARGMALTLDQLGESVTTLEEANAATRVYLDMIQRIVDAGVERNISLKLSQLGLDIDRAVCTDNLRRILEPASAAGFFVRIDMENSPVVQATLDIFTTLWQQNYRSVGIVVQSALYRTEQDVEMLIGLGARVRLVKGAYKEPRSVAHQSKAAVDAAYGRQMERLLSAGHFPAIATHDAKLIARARAYASANGIAKNRFEFQMLYGIRRDLQNQLAADGYGIRVYVPFGKQWFPYFMRRLGERPANVGFVLRGILGDR